MSTEGLVELDKVPLFFSHLVGSLLISTLLTRSWASRAKGKPLSRKGRKGFYRREYLVSQSVRGGIRVSSVLSDVMI